MFNALDKMEAYLSNMVKYDDNMIIVRFLNKIYRLVVRDFHSIDECMSLMTYLANFVKNDENVDRKCLCSLYLHKICIEMSCDVEFPVIRSNDLISVSVEYRPMPDEVKKIFEKTGHMSPIVFAESSKPDEDALNLFNVYISKDHFYGKKGGN